MAFDDKGWPVFPTRDGGAIGTSLENRMIRIVGGTEGIRTRIQTLPDGSTVMLKTRNGMPEFTTEIKQSVAVVQKLFLDNGFVTPGYSAANATIAEALPIFTAATSETTATYAEVLASEIEVEPTAFPSSFLSFTTASYGDVLKAKNAAITACPAAMFTGLARRYVSAIYGKKLQDALTYDLTVNVGTCPTLTYDGVTLNPGQVTTGIVYSQALKRYWMVSIGSSNMTYVPMTVSTAGQEILDKITSAEGSNLNQAYHSYVLSTARVTRVGGEIAWQDGGSFTEVIGAPLNFGWRFSADGTKFTAVALSQSGQYVTDSRLYVGEVSISSSGVLSVGVAVTESVLGWRSNRVKLFSPYSSTDYYWYRTGSVDEAVTNAPLLSFYDDNDTLVVARYARSLGEEEEKKTLSLSGLWTSKQNGWLQIPTGLTTPVSGPCGEWSPPTYITTCGMGDAGYDYQLTGVGDGATVSVGNTTVTERVITEKEVYASTMTPGEYYLADNALQVYDGDSLNGNPTLVNESVVCGTAYFPDHGEMVYYKQYLRNNPGTATYSRSTLGESVSAAGIFIAPQDCPTAWYEAVFESEYVSPRVDKTYDIPAVQSSQKFTGPDTLICEYGVNHEAREETSSETTEEEHNGTTHIKCVTSYGAKWDVALSSGALPKAYKFFGATISNPIVSALVTVREDMHGNVACADIENETIEYFGWPEDGIRSVGWQ